MKVTDKAKGIAPEVTVNQEVTKVAGIGILSVCIYSLSGNSFWSFVFEGSFAKQLRTFDWHVCHMSQDALSSGL